MLSARFNFGRYGHFQAYVVLAVVGLVAFRDFNYYE